MNEVQQSDVEDDPEIQQCEEADLADNVDSDDEVDEEEVPVSVSSEKFVARDGTEWNKQPNINRQVLRHSIVRERCGPSRSTEMLSIEKTFKCFMSLEMADIIMRHTNKKAIATYNAYNIRHPDAIPKSWKSLTVAELYAFFGILIMTGANHSNSESVRDLWNVKSYPLNRTTMGVNRFCSILRFIRFDDANTRAARAQTDKAAPITELWLIMNANLHAHYKPSENLTIDEQLFPFRGRTRFTQYIPSKPAKYGIKVWWICDAKNAYPLHGQIYTGQAASGRETNQGERVVKDLASRYQGSGRNITMDNFFTTLPVAELLLTWNLTIVGTLRKNKTYIPAEMKAHKDRPIGSSLFGFRKNVTMCSYVPRKNKSVTLLSSMHYDGEIAEGGKPEIIEFYNMTKGGVDKMDQLFSEYPTQRQTKRWPLSLFFNMLDITALAAYIVYGMNNPMLPAKSNKRKQFLRSLAEALCMPIIEERALNRQVTRNFSTKIAIESYFNRPLESMLNTEPSTSAAARTPKPISGSCYLCYAQETKRRRKTRKVCGKCKKPMCLEHSITNTDCIICNDNSYL